MLTRAAHSNVSFLRKEIHDANVPAQIHHIQGQFEHNLTRLIVENHVLVHRSYFFVIQLLIYVLVLF